MEPNTENNKIIAAIILSAAMVVAAVIYGQGSGLYKNTEADRGQDDVTTSSVSADPRRSDDARNLYGNPNAAVTIVEFSDFECPFCADLHPTLKQLVDDYEGEINWEYRHLPLPGHPMAKPAAIASECVAEKLGSDAFWTYTEEIFANQGVIDEAFLLEKAVSQGMEEANYRTCIESSVIAARVEKDIDMANRLGVQGTPFSVVHFSDGSTQAVNGALPYLRWVTLLNENL